MLKKDLRRLLNKYPVTDIIDCLVALTQNRAFDVEEQEFDNWENRKDALVNLEMTLDEASVMSEELYSADSHL